jgi:type VI secretion system protein ImpK
MNQNIVHAGLRAATRMAASGHYGAASAMLDALDSAEGTTAARLLRAKMAAQQGRYEESIAHWRAVLAEAPDSGEAQDGLKLAEQLKGRRGGAFFLRANLYYAALLLIVALLVALPLVAGRGTSRIEPDHAAAILDAQQRQLQLSRELAETLKNLNDGPVQLAVAESRAASAEAGGAADLDLNVPGATLSRDGNDLVLSFDDSQFRAGSAVVSPKLKSTLAALGRQLEPHAGWLSVSVVGHTDQHPLLRNSAYRDNASLAMARAVAAIEQMRAASRLPADIFSARSSRGTDSSPHDHLAHESPAQHRTIVLRLSMKKPHEQ